VSEEVLAPRRLPIPELGHAIANLLRGPRRDDEARKNDFLARLAGRFDAVFHLDRAEAVQPLDGELGREQPGEVTETFPAGVTGRTVTRGMGRGPDRRARRDPR
jgi:hypothetical protein